MGCHGAPQLTRRLKVAGEHAAILVVRGGDGWPARRRQFVRCCHAGEQMREDLGEEGVDRLAPFVSDSDVVMGWQTWSREKMGRGRRRAGPAAEKTAHDDFIFILNPFSK
jgi:hypothetical protein